MFIFAKVGDYKQAVSVDIQGSKDQVPKVERFIRWCYPKEGWMRLNTNEAAKDNPGMAGARGIIRGSRGELFQMYAINCGVCSCTRVELLGVPHGFAIAWNGGHHKVLLYVDSEDVVTLFTKPTPSTSPFI